MNYIKTVLNRPVSAILIIVAIVIFGISSITSMRMEYFPDLEMPMELVYVLYPGADADSIEELVAEPIEDVGETLTGINNISSASHENYATIQFTYEYGTDLDDAYMELKEQLDNLKDTLPDDCKTPTIMELSLDEEATISVAAESKDGNDIQDYVNDTIVPKIESINGVAQVEVTGKRDKYLKIVVDENKMKQYGLSMGTVATSIAEADFSLPVGSFEIGSQKIDISTDTNVDWETQLQKVAIKTQAGAIIHLSDVASIMNLYKEDAESISRLNGKDSVLLEISKKSSSATLAVCKKVEEVIKKLGTDEIQFEVIHSSANDIQDSLLEVLNTLIQGVLFTMIILFIFFGDIRASLIVGSSMPLSLFMAMIILNLVGVSFDLMTGTGMIIAIGMIVDSSIVILESCFRVRERETDIKKSALEGVSIMLGSIVASTITTIVVYAPISLATGMSGQMNKPLCYSVIFTMLSSLLCAITVVPLLFTLVKPVEKRELPINKLLEVLGRGYRRFIPKLLRMPKRVILIAVILFVFSIGLATQLNVDLFPSNFDGSIQVEVAFRSGTQLEEMNNRIQQVEEALLKDKNFRSVELEISDGAATLTAYSNEKCKRSSEAAVEEYVKQFESLTNMDITVTPMGVTTGLAALMSTGNNVTITLTGDQIESLKLGASSVEEALAKVPGVLKVRNDFSQSKMKAKMIIDQQKAINEGLSPSSISSQIYSLLNGITATTIDYEDEEYDVKVENSRTKYNDMTSLLDQTMTTSSGKEVALGDLVQIEYVDTLKVINRQDKKYMTTVTATTTTKEKYKISAAISQAAESVELPVGVEKAQSQVDKQLAQEVGNMGTAIVTAIFLVFLVMAIQFESVRLALMVMTCIPFSLIGSFGLLYITKAPLSMMAMMGFLMLVGMVVNNGILLVDAVSQLKKEMPLQEALVQAGMTRLRPILMTTLTTVISMVPMVLSNDSGMTMMKGMGYVIIGGLCTSTLLAMFLMPPFYIALSKEKIETFPAEEEQQYNETEVG